MLFTAIAMELDSDDPSPSSAPHVGLYWAKAPERLAFFDYIVTIIHKLCILLDGVTDSTIIFQAISSDNKNHQLRYASRATQSMPQGQASVDGISSIVLTLAAQACDSTFKSQRRSQYNADRNLLTTWSKNGGFLPAKWSDAPLPLRFDHSILTSLWNILHAHATPSPPSPFTSAHLISITTSSPIWVSEWAPAPGGSGLSHAPMPFGLAVAEDEHSDSNADDEAGIEGEEDDGDEEWVPFARYKGLREDIKGAWCSEFGIGQEHADTVRIMLYEELPGDWVGCLQSYFRVDLKRARRMAGVLRSYVERL
ncbi:hypothetical protein FRC00_005355 [Tulasnella sp. 408]|nr:hypothetical protein FRC00_005355 [Tulasnella sp. 408]